MYDVVIFVLILRVFNCFALLITFLSGETSLTPIFPFRILENKSWELNIILMIGVLSRAVIAY